MARSSRELAEDTLRRRAIEAALWAVPLVSSDAMAQAMARDASGGPNQIALWPRPSDWKNQTLTPSAEVPSLVAFLDTETAGPMVLEVPPAGDAVLMGSVIDAWQVPLVDVGPTGVDKGEGGKYLVMPPGAAFAAPEGFIPVRAPTYRCYAPLRTVPGSSSSEDLARSAAYLRRVRLYPLAAAAAPPPTRCIDVSGVVFDATTSYDLRLFAALHRALRQEPVQAKDELMMAWLQSLGVDRAGPFDPSLRTADILAAAAREAKVWLEDRFLSALHAYYPGSQWRLPVEEIFLETDGTFERGGEYATDARATTFGWTFGAPKNPGTAAFCLLAQRDGDKQPLRGDHSYRLRVPQNVPAEKLWSVSVYDLATGTFLRESPRVSVGSDGTILQRNADGSIDVTLAPRPPHNGKSGWLPTRFGGRYFVLFRAYGPQAPLLDKTWRLPDIEHVK